MKIATLALTALLTLGAAAPAQAQARVVFSSSDGHVQVIIGRHHHHRYSRHRRDPYHRHYHYYGRRLDHPPSRRYHAGHSRRYPDSRYYRVRYPYYGRYPVHHPLYDRD